MNPARLQRYLARYAIRPSIIDREPANDLAMVVVVPCFDEPDVVPTLESLAQCDHPPGSVEVLLVINHPENAPEEVRTRSLLTHRTVRSWAERRNTSKLRFYATPPLNLPTRHAGVGLARKTGMDEAVRRFYRAGMHRGLIVNIDADCTCRPDYLAALHDLMLRHHDLTGCSIYFEHPLYGLKEPMRTHIIDYELHLRCHNISLARAHYPYAYHTVGSSMAASLRAYVDQGGMNRRKAGEDFYFLHKLFPLGGFYNLNTTTVYPGVRPSHKVPFGTGAALRKMQREGTVWKTYNPESYRLLALYLGSRKSFFTRNATELQSYVQQLPDPLGAYLQQCDFTDNIRRIQAGTTTTAAFEKAFFRWFDGLRVLRFFNYAAKCGHPDVEINGAAGHLISTLTSRRPVPQESEAMLRFLRIYEKHGTTGAPTGH